MKSFKDFKNEITEEVEELDEISKELAKKYINKNRDEKIGGASDLDITKDKARKIQNRITGFNKALDRTYSRKDVKGYNEEVEELDEEKIPVQHVTDSVTKVLGTKGASKFLTHLKPGTEKHTTWNKVNNALMDQGIKTQHIASIATHVKPAHFKEEVEELDEIKLATVGKIIKHSPKIASAAIGAAVAAHSVEPPKQPVKATYSQVVKKVQKEEVELDEVLDPSMGAGEYVKDFQKSDAPQFKGKSQEKRRIMGIAAYMAAKREKNK